MVQVQTLLPSDRTTSSSNGSSSSNRNFRQTLLIFLGGAIVLRTINAQKPFLFGFGAVAPPASESTEMNALMAELNRTIQEKEMLQQQLDSASSGGSSSCQERLDQLDGVWDLRRQGRVNAIKTWGTGGNSHVPRNHLFDRFEPESVCFDDERFGSSHPSHRYQAFGDGPKFVCGVDLLAEQAAEKEGNCLVYNVGSNNEVSFEKAVHETMGKGCEVHTFDPTVVPDTYLGKEFSQFHDWGFGTNGKRIQMKHRRGFFNFTELSLQAAAEKLGHQHRTIDVFKIDCEGCEYVALTEAFHAVAEGRLKIDQVQVELHGGQDAPKNFPRVKALFEAADRANMRVFHKERNGWGCKGTDCIEYAFASSDFLRKANGRYVCG